MELGAQLSASADAFARCILNPKHELTRFPGNNLDTAISHLPFVAESNEQTDAFTTDGCVNLYMTGNALDPAYVSRRAITNLNATQTAMRASQDFAQEVVGLSPFLAPLFFGDNKSAVFTDSVTGTVGPNRPGWRMTVGTANMSITLCHPAGLMATIRYWWRDVGGAFNDASLTVSLTGTSSGFTILNGSTAWGFSVETSLPFNGRIVVANNGSGAHTLVIGNHAANCIALRPDYSSMRIKRARTIGLSAWLRYDGSSLNNSGRTSAVQFSPGVYPTEFPGKTLNAQIMSCGLRGVYTGHFKEGIHAKYIQNAPSNYLLLDAPSQTGLLCMTWTSDGADPQPWTLMMDQVIEYTSDDESRERELSRFAMPTDLAVVIADLNRMQLITSNDTHDYVLRLWNKIKRSAIAVAKSPKTWHTIAEVGAGAAAALL